MYTRILVPLDGSKRAERILGHVEAVAQRFEAKVIFLQVIELPPYPPLGSVGSNLYRPDYQEQLGEREKMAQSYLGGLAGEFRERQIEAETRTSYGSVVQSILDTAERYGADLIALASHGRTGLSQVFYGSVAAGVLHHADRPLLIIRSRDNQ